MKHKRQDLQYEHLYTELNELVKVAMDSNFLVLL